MTNSKRAFERAMRLAVVSGLRSTFGVALMEAAYDRPNRKAWALAAMGEAVVDKTPVRPEPGLAAADAPEGRGRRLCGQAGHGARRRGRPLGRADGRGGRLGRGGAGPSDSGACSGPSWACRSPLMGLVEDYIALKVGGDALGLSMEDLKKIGEESVEEVKGYSP